MLIQNSQSNLFLKKGYKMKFSERKPDLVYEKIEIKENKIIVFLQNFWQFSKFYGNYLGSLHSKNK